MCPRSRLSVVAASCVFALGGCTGTGHYSASAAMVTVEVEARSRVVYRIADFDSSDQLDLRADSVQKEGAAEAAAAPKAWETEMERATQEALARQQVIRSFLEQVPEQWMGRALALPWRLGRAAVAKRVEELILAAKLAHQWDEGYWWELVSVAVDSANPGEWWDLCQKERLAADEAASAAWAWSLSWDLVEIADRAARHNRAIRQSAADEAALGSLDPSPR